jgi:hypothetical protein
MAASRRSEQRAASKADRRAACQADPRAVTRKDVSGLVADDPASYRIARRGPIAAAVAAGRIKTTVLGTGFDVRWLPAATQIGLQHGRVRVDDAGSAQGPTFLSAGSSSWTTASPRGGSTGSTTRKTWCRHCAGWSALAGTRGADHAMDHHRRINNPVDQLDTKFPRARGK